VECAMINSMSYSSVAASGMQGFQNGQKQMLSAADKIANTQSPTVTDLQAESSANKTSIPAQNTVNSVHDVAEPLMELQQGKIQSQASVKVMAAADATIGSLLDIHV
jgi:hypothetical protein